MSLLRLSIKYQLLLIVAIIALPALGIIVSSGLRQRAQDIQDAKVETQKLTETIVNEQKNLVAATRQLFIALAQVPEITAHKTEEVQPILTEILRLSPHYSNIFIADPSGEVWVSAVPLTRAISVADRRYFINALASGQLSSGEYHIARTTGLPTLNLGYPLKDASGKVTAVLVAGLSLQNYRKVFDAHSLPAGASFAILDYKGTILARAVEPEKFVGKQANQAILEYMLAGPEEETSIGVSSVVGDTRIQTYRKLTLEGESVPYFFIRTGIPANVVMARANAALRTNLIVYSISLLLAFLVAWLVGKRLIIDRVLQLQRSSQRLAAGELDTRVDDAGGGEIGALGEAFDAMAAQLAAREQALRESERNYRGIFNTTHDALIINDEAGRLIEANRSAERMFGYSRAELLQLSVADLIAGTPPYTFAEAQALIGKALREGTQEFEWLSRRQGGETFWCEIALSPTRLGTEERILAVIRDISERKEMERIKEGMLSSISHEMRTPLTAMLGFLEYVIENRVEDEQLRDYHVTMHKEGERLNEMITNYLDMQRLKAHLQEYDLQPLPVGPLLEQAVALFAGPSARHPIAIDLPAQLPPVFGDAELLHQALVNLLSNAVKYSPEGSEIILAAWQSGDEVTLTVRDRGVGVPVEARERIFDMFFRVEGRSGAPVTGTGLGLALVKEIAQLHRGRVWVESAPEGGSIFCFSLPVAAGVKSTSPE